MTQQEFLSKYDITGASFDSLGYLNHINDFLASTGGKTVEQMKYVSGITLMFNKLMEKQVQPSGNQAKYNVRDLNYRQFLQDYEDAMQDAAVQNNTAKDRKPFEGMRLEAINALKNVAKTYNKDLNNVLVNKVKAGASLDSYRHQTVFHPENMDAETKAKFRGATATMALAMKQVISERTFLQRLNPLNWGRMIDENRFMNQLKAELKVYAYEEQAKRAFPLNEHDIYNIANKYSNTDQAELVSDETLEALDEYYDRVKDDLETQNVAAPSSKERINFPKPLFNDNGKASSTRIEAPTKSLNGKGLE